MSLGYPHGSNRYILNVSSDGCVGIGCTSPTHGLDVNCGLKVTSTTCAICIMAGHASGGTIKLYFHDACDAYKGWTNLGVSEPGWSYTGTWLGNNVSESGGYYGVQCEEAGVGTLLRMLGGVFEFNCIPATEGSNVQRCKYACFHSTGTYMHCCVSTPIVAASTCVKAPFMNL